MGSVKEGEDLSIPKGGGRLGNNKRLTSGNVSLLEIKQIEENRKKAVEGRWKILNDGQIIRTGTKKIKSEGTAIISTQEATL